MDMMGRFAKDLRGFQNLAGLTSQNHCGRILVVTLILFAGTGDGYKLFPELSSALTTPLSILYSGIIV